MSYEVWGEPDDPPMLPEGCWDEDQVYEVVEAAKALHERREAVLRAAWRRAATRASGAEVPAERLYREAAAGFLETLTTKGLIARREALREIVEQVPVWPHESGEFLLAQVGLNATPLLRAAGIASIGSGGGLWSQAKLILPLRRVA